MNKELRKHINQDIINHHNYNNSFYVGKLNVLINDCKPDTLQEWITYYQEYLKYSGKNVILKETIKKILNDYPYLEKQDVQECFRQRCYIDTYDGYKREQEAKQHIENCTKYRLVKTDDNYDRLYGVDFLLVDNNNNVIMGLQIKPLSYFLSSHPGVQRDKEINEKKYKKLLEQQSIQVVEIGYDNNMISYNEEILVSLLQNYKEAI